jgi:hypothetical protein
MSRRQDRASAPARPSLIDRLNGGDLKPAPPPPTPSDMATPSRTGGALAPASATPVSVAQRQRLLRWLQVLAIFLAFVALFLFAGGASSTALLIGGLAVAGFAAATAGLRAARALARRVAVRAGRLTGAALRETPAASGYRPAEAPIGGVPHTLPGAGGVGAPASPEVISAMREGLARMYDRMATPVPPGPMRQQVNIAQLRDKLAVTLDPRRTIVAAYRDRFKFNDAVQWQPVDPIEPVMAAPEFPQPMYAELKKISVDWLLPGFSQIPTNISTLLLATAKMVEAFMAGLNHEMARELLWREYPTDQRGTYFRQFWDVAGFVPQPGEVVDPETLKDITQVHTWPKPSKLGDHSPRPPLPGNDYLVLLVRGDLLRRYPRTVVYAARAKWTEDGLREIDDPAPDATNAEIAAVQAWPLFSGTLEPDGTFFGFKLTVPEVKGGPNPTDDPGWFFVLQEHSEEPRFGLDEADAAQLGVAVSGTNWNNLSWGSLVADDAALDALTTIDLDAQLPNTTAVADPVTSRWHADDGLGQKDARASDLAYITFQRPMRVGIHAADMIP